MPLARIDSTKGLIIDNQSGSNGNIVPPTGTSSQLTAGDGTAVNVGSGLSLAAATLTTGGALPSPGVYTWELSGASPYANIGSGGTATAVRSTISSPSSGGIFGSGRKGLRTYGANANSAAFSAANAFSAAWQSFTIEAYLEIDYQVNDGNSLSYPLIFSQGSGTSGQSNTILLRASGTGANVQYSYLIWQGGTPRLNYNSFPTNVFNQRPIHLAFTLDRTNASAVTGNWYIDGGLILSWNHGALGNFSANFDTFELMRGGTDAWGIIGWASLSNFAKTAAQIRDNTVLLKGA